MALTQISATSANSTDRPLEFSNTIDPILSLNTDAAPIRQGTGDRYTASDEPPLSGSTRQNTGEKLQPYVDVTEQTQPPRTPARRTTSSSFRSIASTAWSKVRYPISHFTVPRLAAPWEHEVGEKGRADSHTVREFDYRRQRRRLFTNSAFQLCITLLFAGGLAACLAGFQTIPAFTQPQKHAFNAIITALSIALGLNIASSFQGYAQMMRWRFLASRYRTLQEFELVLQCESQMKVLRLLWTARTRGRLWVNKTQWLCIIWLGINTLLQVLIALLGLTYSLDTADWVNTEYNQVSIVDLHTITDYSNTYSDTNFQGQLAAANSYGIQGQDYNITVATSIDDQIYSQTIYTDKMDLWNYVYPDYFEYRFQDQDPTQWEVTIVSDRTIRSTAKCQRYPVVEGGYGKYSTFTYTEDGQNITLDAQIVSPGAISWLARINPDCGPRCTEVMALQSVDDYVVFEPGFFKCQSNVSHVANAAEYVSGSQKAALYDMPDQQARIMAGAISWSGFYFDNDPFEYQIYSGATVWSPSWNVSHQDVEYLISRFAMAGIAAMDVGAPRMTVAGYTPVQSVHVTVQWEWAATILSVVPGIQLLALFCIIMWANKAIIKDTSHLSTARLLRPVIEKLGDRGCLLTGDEIAEEMKNVKVAYGYREPDGFVDESSMVRHVDLLDEEEGLGLKLRHPPGLYDGLPNSQTSGNDTKRMFKRRMSV